MSDKVTNLRLAAAATVVATAVGAWGVHVPVLSVACGLALTLALPGYAFMVALFGRGVLGVPERLLISLGMSVTLAVLGGLGLNLIPFGLRAISWSLLLGGVALLALLVAWIRRHEVPLNVSGFSLRPGQMMLFAGAATLVVAAAIISSLGAAAQYSGSAAQLWMLPGAVVNGQQTATIGVDNLEATPIQGTIVVMLGNQVVQTPSSLELDAGAHWQTLLTLPSVSGTTSVLLTVSLLGTGISTSITRHVSLWVAPASAPLTPTATISAGGVTP